MSERLHTVFTGPPSSGKTTLVNILKQEGHRVVPESATQVIGRWLEQEGKQIEDIDRNPFEFQRQVFVHYLESIALAGNRKPAVFDRSIICGEGYVRVNLADMHLDTFSPDLTKAIHRFADSVRVVLYIEKLPTFEKNGVRYDEDRADPLGEALLSVYREFHLEIVRVPVFDDVNKERSIQKRMDLVQEVLKS